MLEEFPCKGCAGGGEVAECLEGAEKKDCIRREGKGGGCLKGHFQDAGG